MSKLSGLTEKIKKHRKLTIAGVVVLALAVGGAAIAGNANKRREQMLAAMNQVQTSQVERRTLVSSVSATGTLTSVNSKEVAVNLNGVEVESVSVQLGDMVESGQVICEFNSEDIEESLAEAKTSLDVTNQKMQMELTVAERNLADAREDYDIDLRRGNTDLGIAYNDYVVALEDVEEAEEEWKEAKLTAIEKKGELELRQEQLSAKKAQLDAAGSSTAYETGFSDARSQLAEYITASGVSLGSAAMDKIGLGNDLSQITIGDNSDGTGNTYDFSSDNAEVRAEIQSRIQALASLQTSYNASIQIETEYAALQQEISDWQTKYNTATQNASTVEKTYEQAVTASQSKLQAYEKQQRTLEDTTKSAENAVITKTESLTTTQLNALTSGNNEEAQVEEYQQQLDDCTVEAPISGIISAVNIEAGDTYSGSAIVTIDDISSFEVTAEIDEYDISKIEKGQKVVIKTNATGDEELEGTVKIVSPKASTGGNEVTYTVIISVDTPNEMLRMDMTAKLSIILENKENVLTVPYEAVQEDESGEHYVEVVDASDAATAKGNGQDTSIDKDPVNKENGNAGGEDEQGMVEEANPENMPQSVDSEDMPQRPEDMNAGNSAENTDVNTRRIYVEKGIESDYYIEIISDEITEGMEVVVPKSGDENGGNIQMMMMRQGPMGGF